jgi:bacteriophage HK97-gp10 putative tail-component
MITGLRELRARLEAIKPNPALMRQLAMTAVAEQKRLVPRKTGNLGRSIGVGRLTPKSAETVATAAYAAAVEFGTRPHTIVPRRKKALRFAPGGSGRLSGSPRKGGAVVFAKRVNHPGTKAQPFMRPGAERAVEKLGVDAIVNAWNKAA